MTISVVASRGSKTSLSTGTSFGVTVSGTMTVGNLVVMGIEVRSATQQVTSITDSRSNSWQVDCAVDHTNLNRRITLASCRMTTALQNADTITVNTSGSTGDIQIAMLHEISGIKTSGWFDKTASFTQDADGNISVNCPAQSVTDEIIVLLATAGSSTSTSWGAGTAGTVPFPTASIATTGSSSADATLHMAYKINTGALAVETMDATPPALASAGAILVASYQPAAAVTVKSNYWGIPL